MRAIGYCTECHRVRYVLVSSAGLVKFAAQGVPEGVCGDCEEELRPKRPSSRREMPDGPDRR